MKTLFTLLIIFSSWFLILGCTVNARVEAETFEPDNVVDAPPTAPPAPQYERPPHSPGPGYAWIGGYWRWNGSTWVWVSGRWEKIPHKHKHWVNGHWRQNKRGQWYWVNGHWE